MIQKISLGIVAAAAISTFAFKAPEVKHETTYALDTKNTSATWVGKKVTGQHNGEITITSGTLAVDHGTIKKGSFEFDMNSITCTDLKDAEWNKKLVDHLKNDDFLL